MSVKETTKPQGLLIDLDGTLYHGGTMVEGADRWIASLKEQGLPYLFVTNNSSATPEAVAGRLTAMGIPASEDRVCTSAQAAAAYIAGIRPSAKVHIIGEDGLRAAVMDAGLEITDEAADYVLQGIDRRLTYEKVSHAVRLIHGGATYILTNPDVLLPADNGLIPGAGSIAAMIRTAGGAEPVTIGKPSSILVDFALNRLQLAAEQTWMIGDNMATDIAAGRIAGCVTALVLTGITTADNIGEHRARSGVEPDLIFKDLKEIGNYISKLFVL
ncbi:TIGR01457 family HAD-type hydrolase [Paenibacillus tarimensis]